MKDLTKVNGVEVMVRESAQLSSPSDGTTTITAPAIHRLLLADETEIFQCMHRNGADCEYTANNAKSVASHQRTHADAKIAREAIKRAEAAEHELADRIARRSDGSRKAAVTRKQQALKTTSLSIAPVTTGAQSKELSKAQNAVIITMNAVNDAIEAYHSAVINLIKLTNEIPACDPQVIAKAKQYDILKSALNGM